MKKNKNFFSWVHIIPWERTCRIMKVLILLLTVSLVSFASGGYSQTKSFDFNFKNANLLEIFNEIEQQSGMQIAYDVSLIDVNERLTLSVHNNSIEDVVKQVLENTNLSYKIMDRYIIISNDNNNAQAVQSLTISGKVTNSLGEPVPGATVVVKGTTNGTITDPDGNYSLKNVKSDDILIFSFVGMKMVEVPVNNQSSISVALEDETIGIEEVVAIGYGTVKKQDLTGAVGSVQGDVISNRQTTQISQALQGAISGVMVTRNNNAPGATASIKIRGITTIGSSDPLIIVDGVPASSINDVNPNDVENISVLKDAASSSIYGSRAAAGVILITTKRAKTGELNLSYNAEFGMESPTRLPDYVDVTRYMQMVNELRWNDNGNNDNEYPLYTQNMVDNYLSLNAENPDLYPITDWVDLILKDNAPRQSHILSLSAGTKNIRTKVSLAYDKTDGLYVGKSYERLTARFNNDIDVTKFLSASVDFFAKRSISKSPSIDPIYHMFIAAPVYAATWSDGRYAEGKTGHNTYAQINEGGYSNNYYNQVGGKVSIDIKPFDGFTLSAIVAPTLKFDQGKNFKKQIPYYAWDDPSVFGGYIQWASSTSLSETRNTGYNVTSQILANYLKSFGDHNLNAMAGYENYYTITENLGASRDQYDLTTFPYLDLGPLEFRDNSGSAYENAYRSYFGRIMYNYQNRYFLQANVRYDGSSRFHEDYRWGSFPSFSAGWVMSEENFMQNVPELSFLKLRASWGNLGNERIGSYYPYQATIAFANALFYQGANVVSAQTAAQTRYAIRDISWETTESIDLGIDASFFDNKLRFTGDYYKKTTKDMLLALEIPDYMGFDNPDQNTGKMNTNGWEIEIGYQNKIGDLKYDVSANLSDFKSVMGDLGGTEFLGDQIKIEGSEFNEWYGYKSEGLYQTEEEVANSATLNTSVRAGDIKYTDISGPDGVPDGIISPEYDRVLLGGSLPRYMFGANIKLQYRDFDFLMVVQGVGKQNSRLGGLMVRPLMENWGHMPKLLDGNYWSQYSSEQENMNATYPRLSRKSEGNNYAMSDYWLINGGYLRMKNITLGYNVPASITQKLQLSSLRVYASASDLFTIDNYPTGWDPEVSSTGYPITSSFVFGLSVKF